jgi:hypothetical protein
MCTKIGVHQAAPTKIARSQEQRHLSFDSLLLMREVSAGKIVETGKGKRTKENSLVHAAFDASTLKVGENCTCEKK